MTEENKDVKSNPTTKANKNTWRYTTIALLVIVVLLLAVFLWPSNKNATGNILAASSNDVANKTLDFVNQNLLSSNNSAILNKVTEESGILNITISIQGREIPVYATTDGKYLIIPQAGIFIDMTQALPKPATEQTATEQPKEVPKTDKPEARAFIMSYCPYGIQFLTAYVPVMRLFGDKADLQVNFVDYAMHGEKEVIENTRMYCIQKEQKDKLVDYLGCFVNSTNAEKCIVEAKVDKAKLETCMNATDKQYNITNLYNDKTTWLSGRYPQYPIYAVLAEQYGVQGSPTFVLNGAIVSPQRTPEAIKQAICAAFKTPPAECNSALNATGTDASGGCST